jgi:hypothetical protein
MRLSSSNIFDNPSCHVDQNYPVAVHGFDADEVEMEVNGTGSDQI